MANVVLNTSLFLPLGKRGVTRSAAEASLVQDLLCYERVFVLADQMDAVGVLCAIMGSGPLLEALSAGALGFVHDRQILAWPTRPPGFRGVMPILAIVSDPPAGKRAGYSQRSAADAAAIALRDFSIAPQERARILELVDRHTLELMLPVGNPEEDGNEGIIRELRAYGEALPALKNSPLRLGHIHAAIEAIRKRRRPLLTSKEWTPVKLHTASGAHVLNEAAMLDPRQLALLDLVTARRFLSALGSVTESSVLHTEPSVEVVLAAQANGIVRAAGLEVDAVLEAERIMMPVLATPESLNYARLIEARSTVAAASWREVVLARDISRDTLLQEYLASLKRAQGGFIAKAARMLATDGVGLFNAVAGMALSVGDTFFLENVLGRRRAHFFVDTTLRRLATGAPLKPEVIVRPD